MTLSRGEILTDPEIIGSGATAGNITFLDGNETNTLTLRVPDNVTSNYTITLPAAPPAVSGYYLQSTDAAGTLAWSPVTAAAAGSNNQIQYNSGGNLTASSQLTFDAANSVLAVSGNATTSAELRLSEDSDNGAQYFAFKAAAALLNNTTYTMPDAIGAPGQVLKIAASPAPTATAATLFWDAPVSGSQTATGNDGDIQMSNGSNGFKNDTLFNYNVTTDVLTVGSGGYSIGGTSVLTATTLGSGVTGSSLTSVGTLTQLQVDNINVNLNSITTTNTDGPILLEPNGAGYVGIRSSGATTPGELRIFDNDNSNSIILKSPAALATDLTITLPSNTMDFFTYIDFASTNSSYFASSRRTMTVQIDGGGNVITSGVKAYWRNLSGPMKVLRWSLLSDVAPTAGQIFTIDVDVNGLGGFPTTVQFSPVAGCSINPTFRKAEAFNLATAGGETGGVTNALWTSRGTTSPDNGFMTNGDILVISVSANTSNISLATFTLELGPLDRTFV